MDKNKKLTLLMSVIAIILSIGTLVWTIGLDTRKLTPQIDTETNYEIVKSNDSIAVIEMKVKFKNLSAKRLF